MMYIYHVTAFLVLCLGIEILVVINKMEKLQAAYDSLSHHVKDVDGGWSDWEKWSKCSKTCESGLRTRTRTCTNPVPSCSGRYCSGSPERVEICNIYPCTNGAWAPWDQWGSCSASCGGGMRSRKRKCSNPAPSPLGKLCDGDSTQYGHCNDIRCPSVVSAFSVSNPSSVTAGGSFYRKLQEYIKVHINTGGDFSPFTGVFKCSKPGIYYFFATLVKRRSINAVDLVECKIYKNTSPQLHLYLDPTDDDTDKGQAAISNSIVLRLVKGDTVFLGGCWDPHTHMEPWSSFSGFLLYAVT